MTYSWDRLLIDPKPGPRSLSTSAGLHDSPPNVWEVTPTTSPVPPAGSTLPRLADELPARAAPPRPARGTRTRRADHGRRELLRRRSARPGRRRRRRPDRPAPTPVCAAPSPINSASPPASPPVYPPESSSPEPGLDGELPPRRRHPTPGRSRRRVPARPRRCRRQARPACLPLAPLRSLRSACRSRGRRSRGRSSRSATAVTASTSAAETTTVSHGSTPNAASSIDTRAAHLADCRLVRRGAADQPRPDRHLRDRLRDPKGGPPSADHGAAPTAADLPAIDEHAATAAAHTATTSASADSPNSSALAPRRSTPNSPA